MSNLTLRRSIITAATLLSLFGGAVAIRAAAGWTAASGPLEQPPNPAALVTQLKNERAHAAALSDELEQVVARAQELRAALEAAQAKAATDAQTAIDLATQLAAAEKKLASLQAQMTAATARRASSTSGAAAPAPVAPGEPSEPGDD